MARPSGLRTGRAMYGTAGMSRADADARYKRSIGVLAPWLTSASDIGL
jgi:hypothetical protein